MQNKYKKTIIHLVSKAKIKPFSLEERGDFVKRYMKSKSNKFNSYNEAENVWINYKGSCVVSVTTNQSEYLIFD